MYTELTGKNIIITGGAGFIGSNIVKQLITLNANKITIIDNLSTGFKNNISDFLHLPNVELLELDITQSEPLISAFQGHDVICHQAALGSVPRSIALPLDTHNANINGFIHVLEAARKNKIQHIVYASSSSVYGDHPNLPKVEHEIGNVLSPYALTKKVNEQYAEIYAKAYGMNFIGFRYFNVFGPNQDPKGAYAAVIPKFLEAIQLNNTIYVDGDGEQTRDFTYVENAVQANLLAINAAFTGNLKAWNKVYNVAVGENFSINRLISELESATHLSAQVEHREPRQGDIRNSLANISSIEENLGYQPKFSFQEGIKNLVEYYNSL